MYLFFFSPSQSWGIRLAHLYEISPSVTMNGLILSFNYLGATEKLVRREKAYNNPKWGWGRVCVSCWSQQIDLSVLDGLGTSTHHPEGKFYVFAFHNVICTTSLSSPIVFKIDHTLLISFLVYPYVFVKVMSSILVKFRVKILYIVQDTL